MLFKGREEIRKTGPAGISAQYGWTRNSGRTWHGGPDINGLDSKTILMPSYTNPATGKEKDISGIVVTSRIVTDKRYLTWEWGWYVCIQLDAGQTPDAVNYLYFCHNDKNLVKAGQRVKTGDAVAIMGMTGNAATTYAHCHFETRATQSGRGLDPTAYMGHPNKAGVYGAAPSGVWTVQVDELRARCGPGTQYPVLGLLPKGKQLPDPLHTEDGYSYFVNCGWLSKEYVSRQ